MASAPTPLVLAEAVEKSYATDRADKRVLRGVSLRVDAGEWVAITGPSGCGKSTLLHLLGGLDAPDAGRVELAGRDLAALSAAERAVLRRTDVGYVFQLYNLVPHLSASANVELPLRLAGTGRRAARARSRDLLGALGLHDAADQLPATLSGGQQQRVAIARALVNEPLVLLADEPTGALDSDASATVLALLRERHAAGQTIVLVTHDHGVAGAADRTIALRDGLVESDD